MSLPPVNVSVTPLYPFRSLKQYHRDRGESPPPAPRNFAGRTELIERVVCLVNAGTPIALIGACGNGKTSVALTLLEDGRIKKKFGNNRRFIRCDEVRSHSHFIRRLSEVTGAETEDTPDLTTLRQFLSSNNIILILDNAETILDPYTPEAPALYSTVEELSTIRTVSLVITTRISTAPTTCQQLQVPTLSMIPAREVFYSIYANQERVTDIDSILQQLDFHPLSVTLIATVAVQNRWDPSRVIREWEQHRVSLLQTRHGRGLPAAVELSLQSPTFTRLGPSAKDILGIIAVLPQGVNEEELEWIFPTVSNARDIIDTLFILSLTHRSHGRITIHGPLQEYLRPTGRSSSLFSSIVDRYLTRVCNITRDISHGHVPSQETQWFTSEKVNIESLLASPMNMNPGLIDISSVRHAMTQIAHSTSPTPHPVDNTSSHPTQAVSNTHYCPLPG